MTKQTEALKLALDALEMHVPHVYKDRGYGPITAIKEALAPTSTQCEVQPEQKPVAFISPGGHIHYDPYLDSVPLYNAPPKRPWVGLTDEEIENGMCMSIQKTCRAIEATLKEKNT